MKNFFSILIFIIGIGCLFNPLEDKQYQVYLQIVGLVLCMFSLYKVSSKLRSKNTDEPENLNL